MNTLSSIRRKQDESKLVHVQATRFRNRDGCLAISNDQPVPTKKVPPLLLHGRQFFPFTRRFSDKPAIFVTNPDHTGWLSSSSFRDLRGISMCDNSMMPPRLSVTIILFPNFRIRGSRIPGGHLDFTLPMDSVTPVFAALALLVLYVLYRRYSRISLSDIPGPAPESFWLGSSAQLAQREVGEIDFQWLDQYGGIAKFKGPLGDDRLWISDSKALHYIFQTSGYNFPKQPERRAVSQLLSDHGLVWADGNIHKRQRKVMQPAFGLSESKALFPLFSRCAQTITTRWQDLLSSSSDQSAVVNVPRYLAPATLDAIGEAAFDVHFGASENQDHELAQGFNNLLADGVPVPSSGKVFAQDVSRFIPLPILEFLYENLPGASLRTLRANRDVTHKIAKDLLDSKSDALAQGKYKRDVMSILVRANASENARTKLNDFEMISQMRTMMLAGHETTTNSLSWAFLELAKNPAIQKRLRDEVHAMEATIHSRGQSEFAVSDIEAMPYTQAVIKEVLRFHPVVFHNHRISARDDVIPLSEPITTLSGKLISEVPIPKGTRVVLSIAAYNRSKAVWGEDSHTFNPERWLHKDTSMKGDSPVGVFSNLLTFSGGVRSCIGWRFALYEMQAILVELISNFEFGISEDIKKLRRQPSLAMIPVLDGEHGNGVQLPLRISLVQRD
ncbi:cytochrome P450 [Abortiporus biennis]|nr:cytochrome P450 [Abortiporus biennis]